MDKVHLRVEIQNLMQRSHHPAVDRHQAYPRKELGQRLLPLGPFSCLPVLLKEQTFRLVDCIPRKEEKACFFNLKQAMEEWVGNKIKSDFVKESESVRGEKVKERQSDSQK